MIILRRPSTMTNGRGFTLIEVVIALSLLSLIMMGLISALGSFGATASRLDERAGKSGAAWQVGDFLRASLSSSVGQLKQTLPDGSQSVYFRGAPHELVWLGSMPARYGAGGVHHFHLGLAPDARGNQLLLQYAPYVKVDGVQNPPATSTPVSSAHVLADAVTAFRVAYQRKPKGPAEQAEWFDTWEDTERLPGRLRIDIELAGSSWPPLFITLATPEAGGGVRIVHGPVE